MPKNLLVKIVVVKSVKQKNNQNSTARDQHGARRFHHAAGPPTRDLSQNPTQKVMKKETKKTFGFSSQHLLSMFWFLSIFWKAEAAEVEISFGGIPNSSSIDMLSVVSHGGLIAQQIRFFSCSSGTVLATRTRASTFILLDLSMHNVTSEKFFQHSRGKHFHPYALCHLWLHGRLFAQ